MKKFLFSVLAVFLFCATASVFAQTIDYVKESGFNDPLFVNPLPPGRSNGGDYSLLATSPAINAGDNSLYPGLNADTKDLAGYPRLHDGTTDMGAFEYQGPVHPDPNNIVYVNKNVSGGNGSGDSWINAVAELADALKYAQLQNAITPYTSANPLKIYVAKGTYKPLYSPADNNFGNPAGRDNSFLMVKNVQLYGGFAGGEATLTDRDLGIAANETILSGDVNGDDVISGSGSILSITNNADNNYHVVVSAGAVETALLDGFTLTGGNANGNGNLNINQSGLERFHGGAMNNYFSSPSLTNVTLSGNSGDNGGGMYNFNSSPSLTNVIISRNTASNGGGFHNRYGNGSFINCTITGNTPNEINAYGWTFWKNTIVWGNINGSNYSAENCLVKVNSNTNNGNIDATGLTDTDIFTNPAIGDYSLKATSPAINAGNNSLYPGLNADTKDLAGNSRVYNYTSGGIIDMGAYEFHVIPITPGANNILYVDINVIGGEANGSSWTNAVEELADALKYAQLQNAITPYTSANPLKIYVAKGTYKPLYSPADNNFGTDQGRDNSFLMVNNVQLYGGFAGGEATLAVRNLAIVANETILSGDVDGDDVISGSGSILSITNNADNNYHVVVSAGAVETALLDGFTLTGGNANGTSTLTINQEGLERFNGGAMNNYASSPSLTNVTLSGNSGDNGGGMYNFNSSPSLTNVTLSGNSAYAGDGMINLNSSSPVLTNVTLSGNSANIGGGMHNFNSSSPVLTNVTLSGNSAANVGGGMYNSSSSPSLTNVIISGNTASNGGGVYNRSGNGSFINCTITGNSPNEIFAHGSTSWKNTIVWGKIDGSGYSAENCLVKGSNNTGNGNLDATGLTDTDIFTNSATGDYSLKATSPAINAGNNSLYPGLNAETKDLAGNPRVFNYASGGTIDLGAYENDVPAAVAGTITGATTVCSGANSTSLTLSGYTGNIQWQESLDNLTFNNIVGATGATYTVSNLTATTWYRVVVTSGNAATSPIVTVTVNVPPSVTTSISNPHLYFGAPGDQTSTITASATGRCCSLYHYI